MCPVRAGASPAPRIIGAALMAKITEEGTELIDESKHDIETRYPDHECVEEFFTVVREQTGETLATEEARDRWIRKLEESYAEGEFRELEHQQFRIIGDYWYHYRHPRSGKFFESNRYWFVHWSQRGIDYPGGHRPRTSPEGE